MFAPEKLFRPTATNDSRAQRIKASSQSSTGRYLNNYFYLENGDRLAQQLLLARPRHLYRRPQVLGRHRANQMQCGVCNSRMLQSSVILASKSNQRVRVLLFYLGITLKYTLQSPGYNPKTSGSRLQRGIKNIKVSSSGQCYQADQEEIYKIPIPSQYKNNKNRMILIAMNILDYFCKFVKKLQMTKRQCGALSIEP